MNAFPNPNRTDQAGMELRDYFASNALPSFIAHAYAENHEIVGIEEICGLAYALADEMMIAREK
jgi:hypothetical protein